MNVNKYYQVYISTVYNFCDYLCGSAIIVMFIIASLTITILGWNVLIKADFLIACTKLYLLWVFIHVFQIKGVVNII